MRIRKEVYNNNWHKKSREKILKDFEVFSKATIAPNAIIDELRLLHSATLELLENRSLSSVYRIKQNGEIYQVNAGGRAFQKYKNIEEYEKAEKYDTVVSSFEVKEPVFVIRTKDGRRILERNAYPRFIAEIAFGPKGELENVQVIDHLKNDRDLDKYMKKAVEFLRKQLSFK